MAAGRQEVMSLMVEHEVIRAHSGFLTKSLGKLAAESGRYHKALGDVTPADVIYGRREQIIRRRKAVQAQTIQHRRDYNHTLRELLLLS
jgi:uncharacterized protein YihD (DUF1040 family)